MPTRTGDAGRGRYLPTGLRIVGADAARLFEGAAPADEGVLPRAGEGGALFGMEAALRPARGVQSVVEPVLEALTDEIRLTWAECPALRRDADQSRAPSRFGGLTFRCATQGEAGWIGELTWRSVHPIAAGAPITTTVILAEKGRAGRLFVRVAADDGLSGVRGYVGAGQAHPTFLQALAPRVTLSWMDRAMTPEVIPVGGVPRWLRSVVEAPDRAFPVAVQAPREDGSYAFPPEELARELLGRAFLYVIPRHDQTFELSDAVGDRRMSCFWGAIRCYLPGWSRHDDPLEHPLLLGDRVEDPVMRARWMGEVGLWMARRVALPVSHFEIPEREEATEAPTRPGASGADGSVRSEGGAGPEAGPSALGSGGRPGGIAPDQGEAAGSSDPGAAGNRALAHPGTPGTSAAAHPGTAGTSAAALPGTARTGSVADPRAGVTGAVADPRAEGATRSGAGSEPLPHGAAPDLGSGPAGAPPPPDPALSRLVAAVQELSGMVRDLLVANGTLTDEVERLRTLAAVRSSSTNAIERRLGRLEDLLERSLGGGDGKPDSAARSMGDGEEGAAHDTHRDAWAAADPPDPTPDFDGAAPDDEGRLTVAEVVRSAAETHPDALLILDSAVAAAVESPYEDPERVRAILDAMARVARRRRDGQLGTALREAFSDLGIDYRGAIARSTPARLRQQYRFQDPAGRTVEAEEHIVLGNTYDPRRCLRIYFSSRVPRETRFVVGHVGRHFEVLSST